MTKTFAQLKRDLQVGKKLKCVYNACKKDYEGLEREITKKQTNAITLKTVKENGEVVDSWLWLPKTADLVHYEDNKFSFFEAPASWNNFTKTLIFTYELLEE